MTQKKAKCISAKAATREVQQKNILRPGTLLKKNLIRMFSSKLCEISKNTLCYQQDNTNMCFAKISWKEAC